MKIRMKISFMAFEQFYTIQELFLIKILDSYNKLNKKGLIKNPYPSLKDNKKFLNIIKGKGNMVDLINANGEQKNPTTVKQNIINNKINLAMKMKQHHDH